MIFGSVCSGMEAASLAWTPLGWKCAFVSEIDKAPCALLKERYPDVPNFGDMTKFEGWPDVAIDLLVGGTPCQSFSVAGLRKGLTDPRGSLMLTYGAIAKRYRPTWLLWENVPGVLSSNEGRDFGAFLGMLAELGYGFAYRVLDAQFVGLAQRRKRVFVVGYLGDWRPPAAVLFESESLRGDSPPRREAGQRAAPTISARTKGDGGLGTDAECDGALAPEVSYALNDKAGARIDGESETFVTHALRADGFDASEDGTGRRTPLVPVAFSCKDHGADAGELAPTLRAMGHAESHANAYQTSGNCGAWETGDHVGAIDTMTDPNSHVVAFDTTQITNPDNRSQPKADSPCHPVTAEGHAPAIAYNITPSQSNMDYNARPTQRSQAITTDGNRPSARGGDVIAFDTYNQEITGDVTQTLCSRGDTPGGNSHLVPAVTTEWAVRRLTPRECERLQGAPDDYTLVTYRGKPMADGPRYKMIGNSFAVNCVRWIGERIDLVRSEMERAA